MARRRALVLGAGGHAAHAWEIGLIAGLAENGLDVRTADLFVGTSAGAVVAAQLTSGLSLDELFGRQVDSRLQLPEPAPPVDFVNWRASVMKAKEASVGAVDFLRRVGSLADAPTATPPSEARNTLARRLPIHTWPGQPLLVATVDVTTGERRAFGRESGVDFVDAVTASNTVPGIWPLVMIDGRGYMDGGFYSIDNADLATGCDRVLVLTLPARIPPLCVVSLDVAVQTLRANGALVEVVHPDEATNAVLASHSGNLLDPSIREPAARAGREQGRRMAAGRIAALWE